MLRILFLLFQFNYAFTIGYIPIDDLQIYHISYENNFYFVEFESEINIMKYFFIYGRIRSDFYEEKFLRSYNPYCIDFEVKTGIKLEFMEIGFSHNCIHPIVTYCNEKQNYPIIRYEGAREELYLKFSNKI